MVWEYGFNWLNMLASTLWIVLLVVLVWVVIHWLNNRTVSPTRQAQTLPENSLTAIEIVNQRYARGEIDTTTFDQMREKLEESDNTYQGGRAEISRPAGESLFDGNNKWPKDLVEES